MALISDPKLVSAAALDDLIRRREELLAELDTLHGATAAAHNIAVEQAAIACERVGEQIAEREGLAAMLRVDAMRAGVAKLGIATALKCASEVRSLKRPS